MAQFLRREMKRSSKFNILSLLSIFTILLIAGPITHTSSLTESIGWVTKIDGSLTSGSGKELINLIEQANDQDIAFLIIQIDTPGGRVDTLRELVKSVLNSRMPIISYVGPQGARSASAGTYLVIASHIAAMAPATNIGSSTPVLVDGSEPSEDMRNKMINDSAAYIRGLAKQRDRNAEWAEKSVRDSENITSEEALKLKVIDFIAPNISDLLIQIDGTKLNVGTAEITFSPSSALLVDKSVTGNISYSIIWIVSGIAMILAEFLFSGFIVVFFGLGAVVAGAAIALGVDGSGGIPFIIFSVSSILLLLIARNQMKAWFQGDLVTQENSDIDIGIVGDTAEVVSGFDQESPGIGVVSYRGSNWNARSSVETHAVGSRLEIVSRKSNVLII